MKLLILMATITLSLLGHVELEAQSETLNGLYSIDFSNTGEIRDQNGVTGYYILTRRKKERRVKGKKRPEVYHDYYLELYDVEFNHIGQKVIRDNDRTTILAIAYNGEYLGILMADIEEKKKWLEIVDADGETIHRKSLKPGPFDTPQYAGTMEYFGFVFLEPTDGGFIVCGMEGKSAYGRARYSLTYVPNDTEIKGWTRRAPETGKGYETANILAVTDSLLFFNVTKQKTLLSQKLITNLHVVNVNTGKTVYKTKQDDGTMIQYRDASVVDDEVWVVGIDVGKENRFYTESPERFHMLRLSQGGKVIGRQEIAVEKITNAYEANGQKLKGSMYLHQMLIGDTGHTSIATEYYKSFNGDISPQNGFVIHLTPDFEVADLQTVDKGALSGLKHKTRVLGGGQISLGRKGLNAAIAAGEGKMDYALGYVDQGQPTMAYFTNGDKKKKMGRVLHVITAEDNQLNQEKLLLTSGNNTIYVFPNRPGYIGVVEYDHDEKSLDLRVERLTN